MDYYQRKTELFQSTCPARGTTSLPHSRSSTVRIISIHVPREGHDAYQLGAIKGDLTISIHVPREGHDAPVHGFNGLN